MGADDEDRLVSPFGEETRAGEYGGLRVVVAERPFGVSNLAGVVGHVAGDHRPRGRSFPTQVSTTSFSPGASTSSAWTLSFRVLSSSLTEL